VGTLAIGRAGAINAALLAAAILATHRPEVKKRLREFREEQTRQVAQEALPARGSAAPAERSRA
jgi:5-(carboxyamino)imidazole ribonucleotide mutase